MGTATTGERPRPVASPARYALAVAVLVGAIGSQYVVPAAWPASRVVYGSLAADLAIVYLLPVAAFAALVGLAPLRGWRSQLPRASVVGLGWYGALSLLGLGVLIVLAAIYLAVAPGVLHLLARPNPELTAAAHDPWFYVGLSFVVGAFEETLFRGWVFGYWIARGAPWLLPAVLSSLLFAGVHVYYGTTYGAAAPLIFPSLFLVGLAFAATYRETSGNLVVPAVLHGAHDAAAYLTLVSLALGTAVGWGLVGVGALVGLLYVLQRPAPARTGGGGTA